MTSGAAFSGGERFELQRQLGAGGMGVVYQAYDRERDALVALKTMSQVDAASLYRFKREFRTLADLAHPNLVTLHELFFREDQWFFTMELVHGVNFVDYMRGVPGGPERHQRLVAGLRQLVDGVGALHAAGHLHRDIKPSNVLVTEQGRVVLLDFGLVTPLGYGGRHSTTPRLLGTLAYMAPEQGSGRPLSEASDWYSVGLMLYQTLTGRVPFVDEEPSDTDQAQITTVGVTETTSGREEGIHERVTRADVQPQQLNWIRVLSARQDSEPPPAKQLAPDVPAALDDICAGLLRCRPEARLSRREILERLGAPEAGAAPLDAAADTPFVGRVDQLRALQEAFDVVRRGRAVTVYVHGSSGIGKTALIRRFLDGLIERDRAVVLEGRCYAQESVPYKALDSVVDSLSHYLACLSRSQAAELLPRDTWALARAFPVLGRVEAIAEWPQRPMELADPLALRRRAFLALRELLARAGDRRRLVLFVDDLQWGDVDSAQLLSELTRPPEAPVMLLLVSYRSEDACSSPLLRELRQAPIGSAPADDVRDLELETLSAADARALALALLRGEADPEAEAYAALIARESKGHPLFVHELAQQARRRLPAAKRQPAEPELTLDEVLRSRLAQLAPDARRVLEVLAIAGQPILQSVAQRAAALAGRDQGVVRSLRNGHLIRVRQLDGQPCLETFHDRIRETVATQLSAVERRECHRRLAHALEQSAKPDAEALAFHFGEAGEARIAYRHARVAADRAAEAFAFERAAKLYRRCLELVTADDPDAQGLLARAGEALANAGRGAEAARCYLDAAQRAGTSEALELQRRAAEQYLASGLLDEGLAVTRSVLLAAGMRLPETPRRALPSLLLGRAYVRLRGLRFRERDPSQIPPRDLARIDVCRTVAQGLSLTDHIRGADFQTRHLLLALRAGEPYRLAIAFALETSYCATPGGPARRRAELLMKTTMELAQRVGNPHAIGLATFTRGLSDYLVGRWKSCFEQCERATQILHDNCIGVVWELASAQRFSLAALAYMGDVAEISRRAGLLLDEAKQRGNLYAATHLLTRYGHFSWLAADAPEQGQAHVEEAMAQWTQSGFHLQHYSGLVARSQCDLYRRDTASAQERMNRVWPELQASLLLRVQALRLEAIHLRARCALAAAGAGAQRASLLASAERAASRIERERMPWADPLAWLVRAAVAAARGESAGALQLCEKAAGAFAAADMSLYAAAARRRGGELLGGERGQAAIAESEALMLSLGVKNPARMLEVLAPGFPSA